MTGRDVASSCTASDGALIAKLEDGIREEMAAAMLGAIDGLAAACAEVCAGRLRGLQREMLLALGGKADAPERGLAPEQHGRSEDAGLVVSKHLDFDFQLPGSICPDSPTDAKYVSFAGEGSCSLLAEVVDITTPSSVVEAPVEDIQMCYQSIAEVQQCIQARDTCHSSPRSTRTTSADPSCRAEDTGNLRPQDDTDLALSIPLHAVVTAARGDIVRIRPEEVSADVIEEIRNRVVSRTQNIALNRVSKGATKRLWLAADLFNDAMGLPCFDERACSSSEEDNEASSEAAPTPIFSDPSLYMVPSSTPAGVPLDSSARNSEQAESLPLDVRGVEHGCQRAPCPASEECETSQACRLAAEPSNEYGRFSTEPAAGPGNQDVLAEGERESGRSSHHHELEVAGPPGETEADSELAEEKLEPTSAVATVPEAQRIADADYADDEVEADSEPAAEKLETTSVVVSVPEAPRIEDADYADDEVEADGESAGHSLEPDCAGASALAVQIEEDVEGADGETEAWAPHTEESIEQRCTEDSHTIGSCDILGEHGDQLWVCRQGQHVDARSAERIKDALNLLDTSLLKWGTGNNRVWLVIGGHETGGLLVRSGPELDASLCSSRLAHGSLVEQQLLMGTRLKYLRLTGTGPICGWVTTQAAQKQLMFRLFRVHKNEGFRTLSLGAAAQSPCEIVPMGQYCLTATLLKRQGWRRRALPLDWCAATFRVWNHMLRDDFKTLLCPRGSPSEMHPYNKLFFPDVAMFIHQGGWANEDIARRVARLRSILEKGGATGLAVYLDGPENCSQSFLEVLEDARGLLELERGFRRIVLVWIEQKTSNPPRSEWLASSMSSGRMSVLRYTPAHTVNYYTKLSSTDSDCIAGLLREHFPATFPCNGGRESEERTESAASSEADAASHWNDCFNEEPYWHEVSKREGGSSASDSTRKATSRRGPRLMSASIPHWTMRARTSALGGPDRARSSGNGAEALPAPSPETLEPPCEKCGRHGDLVTNPMRELGCQQWDGHLYCRQCWRMWQRADAASAPLGGHFDAFGRQRQVIRSQAKPA